MEDMDQVKSHKIEAFTQIIKAHNYIIKLAPLLVSLSVFSFLFSPSSFLACFSSFPLQLFTHTIDKNCMFLLCNGLLVFVGITKSLSGSSGADESSSKNIEDGSQIEYSDVEANESMLVVKEVQEKTNELDEQNTEVEYTIEIRYCGEEVEENIENVTLGEEGKGSSQSVLIEEEEPDEETGLFGDEEEEEESEIDEFLNEESVEEEETVEEPNWVLSTEELNKKFDDFIRRMKEDLRIEAQRQLLMV